MAVKKTDDFLYQKNRKVLWCCENGHEWLARVADRARGHDCPYCVKQKGETRG